jgi:hypothetical protein
MFLFLSQLASLSKWIRNNKDCHNDFYTPNHNYSKRYDVYGFIVSHLASREMDYLEFGVANGESLNWWLLTLRSSHTRFYGFDTFNGLPEKFGKFKKGDMGREGIYITDPRCKFIIGMFQDTLIPFLKQYDSSRYKVIHMDADLYSSTLFVLMTLTPYLHKDDIIIFDEFNVPLHEFKAFKDWTDSTYTNYKVICGVNNFHQIAIILT